MRLHLNFGAYRLHPLLQPICEMEYSTLEAASKWGVPPLETALAPMDQQRLDPQVNATYTIHILTLYNRRMLEHMHGAHDAKRSRSIGHKLIHRLRHQPKLTDSKMFEGSTCKSPTMVWTPDGMLHTDPSLSLHEVELKQGIQH